jgi:DAPG hydrolase PhiG domain
LIGGQEQRLKISFKDPATYFGADYKEKFKSANVSTAVVGTVGFWSGKGTGTTALQVGHLLHLVHSEGSGSRMRSRFWLGDLGGVKMGGMVPMALVKGLLKHATEEMAYLRTFLPDFYENKMRGPKRMSEPYVHVVPFSHG